MNTSDADAIKIEALEEKLASANGALNDILTMCEIATDMTIYERIHARCLNSCSVVYDRPIWHANREWERKNYDRYFNGTTKACASNQSCYLWAKLLTCITNG